MCLHWTYRFIFIGKNSYKEYSDHNNVLYAVDSNDVNLIGSVMVCVLASKAVDHGFEPDSASPLSPEY